MKRYRTALHKAAGESDLAKVRALLSAGADPNTQDENGNSPLHLAYQKMRKEPDSPRCREVVEALLRGGADPNLRNSIRKVPEYYLRHTPGQDWGALSAAIAIVGVAAIIVGLLGSLVTAVLSEWQLLLASGGIGAMAGLCLYLLSRVGIMERTLTYRVHPSGSRELIRVGDWVHAGYDFLGKIGAMVIGCALLAMFGVTIYVIWKEPGVLLWVGPNTLRWTLCSLLLLFTGRVTLRWWDRHRTSLAPIIGLATAIAISDN